MTRRPPRDEDDQARRARIDALRRQLEEGTYPVDGGALAARMLEAAARLELEELTAAPVAGEDARPQTAIESTPAAAATRDTAKKGTR